ncbi:lysylphosphatidylglycerol synthase domain-containing protein [Segnochrobactraceae bacterium EtOH-i3]
MASQTTGRTRSSRLAAILGGLAILVVFAAAVVALVELAGEVTLAQVDAAIRATPLSAILLGALFVTGSYLTLTLYDRLALAFLGKNLPYRHVCFASFTSYAFSNTIGFAPLTGGSIRYRLYTALGLDAVAIASLVGIITLTFSLGIVLASGLVLVVEPDMVARILRLPTGSALVVGWLLIGAIALYLLFAHRAHMGFRIGGRMLRLPGPGMSLAQIAVAVVEMGFASVAFMMLLPPEARPDWSVVAGAFVLAMGLGSLSHVPGGLGVFEATLIACLPGLPVDLLLGRLVLFRLLYYVLPLVLAATLLAVRECAVGRRSMLASLRSGCPKPPDESRSGQSS